MIDLEAVKTYLRNTISSSPAFSSQTDTATVLGIETVSYSDGRFYFEVFDPRTNTVTTVKLAIELNEPVSTIEGKRRFNALRNVLAADYEADPDAYEQIGAYAEEVLGIDHLEALSTLCTGERWSAEDMQRCAMKEADVAALLCRLDAYVRATS